MGCGISKPNLDDEHVPTTLGLNPIRRRINQLKQGKPKTMTNSNSTLSAKQLLDQDGVDEDEQLIVDSPKDEGRKSVSINPMEIVQPVKIEKLHHPEPEPEPEKEKLLTPSLAPPPVIKIENTLTPTPTLAPPSVIKRENILAPEHVMPVQKVDVVESHSMVVPVEVVAPLVEKKQEEVTKGVDVVESHSTVSVAVAPPSEVKKLEYKEDHEKEELEDDDEESVLEEGDGSRICPGSPSFREYYIASVANSRDLSQATMDNDGDEKSWREESVTTSSDGEKGEEKSRRKESIGFMNSSEGSPTAIVKKGQRGKRFRKVLPKGGQAAVKNLLNVKSCYYTPPCSNFHDKGDKPHLLIEKETSSTASSQKDV